MSITPSRKSEIIREYKKTENDTGSTEVQCAIITQRIKNLTEHFKQNKKDFHSKRGLIAMVERRKKLTKYLKRVNPNAYLNLIKNLGLRK